MPAARSLKVMVVDDQQSMRGLARQCLKRMGIVDVTLAASGDQAMKDLQAAKYDVVISDLNMPGMSGADLAKEVKAHPVLKSVLFCLATSEMYRDQAEEGLVDHFVAKPFSVADLKNALEASLGKLK
jgi:two-component system chemotaxis response regulator CheY